MEQNPYESPREVECVKRPKPQKASVGVLVAAAIIIPLAILNLIRAFWVMFIDTR
jgi:hypothetical protein